MKTRITLFLSSLVLLLCTLSAYAQNDAPVRTVIFLRSMHPLTYWSSQIDSIKFITEDFDLSLSINVSPKVDEIGKAEVKVNVGQDVQALKIQVIESYRLRPNTTDEDLMALLSV